MNNMKTAKEANETAKDADYWVDYQITILVEPVKKLPALPVIQF